jgi:hypothetical protein
MSAGTNAFGARAGFNQSGGAYFMCVQPLETAVASVGSYINQITAAPSGSGGAVVAPTFALVSMSSIVGGTPTNGASTLVGTGKLLKDMGRTVVSAGRTFRKFAPVVATGAASTFGAYGATASGASTGYATFYLEVGREGAGSAAPAPIARYF